MNIEEKENMNKVSLKRRNSNLEYDMVLPKVQPLIPNVSNNQNEIACKTVEKKPTIIASSSLTDSFKVICKFNETRENREESASIGTPEEQILPIEEFKKLPKPKCNSVERKNSPNDQMICCDGTPKEQVLPFDKFKKLPRPLLTSSDVKIVKNVSLNRCVSDSIAFPINQMLDDSFEMVKYGLQKTHSLTPINEHFNPSFLTPETPCDINDIDLETEGKVVAQLPCLTHCIPLKRRKNLEEFYNVSPMCYESKPNKKEEKRTQRIFDEIETGIEDPQLDTADHSKISEISAERVVEIIENDYIVQYDNILYAHHIIDCRYPYEYEGGHIDGAVNLYSPYQLLQYVFLSNFDEQVLNNPLEDVKSELSGLLARISSLKKVNWKNKAYIFHCEFSSIRGPEMASLMRNVDRLLNINCYPYLFFPKIFIMKKGYKDFYRICKRHCFPGRYVRMNIVDPSSRSSESADNELDDSVEESDNEEVIDKETIDSRIKQYNDCKSEAQEQMKVLKQLMKDFDSNK